MVLLECRNNSKVFKYFLHCGWFEEEDDDITRQFLLLYKNEMKTRYGSNANSLIQFYAVRWWFLEHHETSFRDPIKLECNGLQLFHVLIFLLQTSLIFHPLNKFLKNVLNVIQMVLFSCPLPHPSLKPFLQGTDPDRTSWYVWASFLKNMSTSFRRGAGAQLHHVRLLWHHKFPGNCPFPSTADSAISLSCGPWKFNSKHCPWQSPFRGAVGLTLTPCWCSSLFFFHRSEERASFFLVRKSLYFSSSLIKTPPPPSLAKRNCYPIHRLNIFS